MPPRHSSQRATQTRCQGGEHRPGLSAERRDYPAVELPRHGLENKVTSGITFFELPSTEPTCSTEPLKTWTHSIGSLKIADFTMDPAQDLLVLVALAPPRSEYLYSIHLRSLATNEPHPDSSQSMGILPCLPRMPDHQVAFETTGAVRVQVAGDLVALLVKEVHDSVSAHLQIWNWRYGGHHSCSMGRVAGIEDFTFITDNTFLIVRPSGRFECYTFENPVSCSTTPTLRSSYNLPPLEDGYMYWYICMSSNPAPGYLPRREGTDHRVYYPRPEERIHACCLYIFKPTGPGDHHVHSFVFFLNVRMFLEAPPPTPRDNYPLAPYSSRVFNALPARPRRQSPLSASTATSSSSALSPSAPLSLPEPLPAPGPATQPQPARTRQMHLRSLYMSSGGGGVRTVPWDEWGPANTRWFDEVLSTDWQHALYGLRTVECVNETFFSRRRKGKGKAKSRTSANDDENTFATPPIDTSTLPTVNDLLNGGGFHVNHATNVPPPFGVAGGTVQPVTAVGPSNMWPRPAKRYLRIRDYNPYIIQPDHDQDSDESTSEEEYPIRSSKDKGRGKAKADLSSDDLQTDVVDPSKPRRGWTRRLVTTPSTTPSRGVFAKDIVSALPYSEVVSRDRYLVTDVMMDDCRILLIQRGRGGKLQGIDVFTM